VSKISEPQRKALKALAIGVKCMYVDAGRFTHAYWCIAGRPQCTATMKALLKKGLVRLVRIEGSHPPDRDVQLTDAGRAEL